MKQEKITQTADDYMSENVPIAQDTNNKAASDKYITYIWQMGRGSGIFRFQTTDPLIARKLSRTKGWESVVTYCNRPFWMFQKSFPTQQKARDKLKSLCKVRVIQKGDDTGEFFAETYQNTTSISKPVTTSDRRGING